MDCREYDCDACALPGFGLNRFDVVAFGRRERETVPVGRPFVPVPVLRVVVGDDIGRCFS